MGSPCRVDANCDAVDDLFCDLDVGQCRVAVRGLCDEDEQCDSAAECVEIVCDDAETRCYRVKGAACDEACDCTGRWVCHEDNGVCVECIGGGCREEGGRDECTDGGFCVAGRLLGGRADARINLLGLMVDCWNASSQSNEAEGCAMLTLDEVLIIGGMVVPRLGPADDPTFEAWVCDDEGGGAVFAEAQYDVLRELFGCGLLNLFNVFWRDPLPAGSAEEWCLFYVPNKADFGFPSDVREAVVVAPCATSSF